MLMAFFFSLVTYRKHRPAGIPIIIRLIKKESAFWRANSHKLADEIVTVTQKKLLIHKIKKDGTMAVIVSYIIATNKLLALTTLAVCSICPVVPPSYHIHHHKTKQHTSVDIIANRKHIYIPTSRVLIAQRC